MTLCKHHGLWRSLAIVLILLVVVWLSLNPQISGDRRRDHPSSNSLTDHRLENSTTQSPSRVPGRDPNRHGPDQEYLRAENEARDEALAVAALLRELKNRSAEDAAHWMNHADLGLARPSKVQGVALAWSAEDYEAELQWAARISDPEDRAIAIETGLRFLQNTDPARAAQAALEAGLSPHVTADLTLQWAWRDLPAATAWVERQPDGVSRDEMNASIALVLGATDPARAADAVAGGIPPGPLQEQAAFGVLQNWMASDPDGARAWVNLFPEGELKTRAENEFATGVAASQ
jgi:hypothetical protein